MGTGTSRQLIFSGNSTAARSQSPFFNTLLRNDFRSDSLIRKDLDEQRVRQAAVVDVYLFDSRLQRVEGRFHLGDHSRIDRAVGDQFATLAFREMRHERVGVGSVAANARN